MSPKEQIIATVQDLPDDADYEDAIEALCLRMTLEERLRDLDNGIYMDHEEVKYRLTVTI